MCEGGVREVWVGEVGERCGRGVGEVCEGGEREVRVGGGGGRGRCEGGAWSSMRMCSCGLTLPEGSAAAALSTAQLMRGSE